MQGLVLLLAQTVQRICRRRCCVRQLSTALMQ
jgi:hypothetical protein